MKKYFLFLILFSLLATLACNKQVPVESSERLCLNNNWEFRADGEASWIPASVPGCVHTDLLKNNLIPDPYFRTNEDSVQWVSQKTWEYRTHFHTSSLPKNCDRTELVFEGIDTHVDIFLNGTLINDGKVDNMFRTWRFDVSDKLNKGENNLLVKFYPATEYNKNEAAKLAYTLPDERAFSRKAPYQFGWDWGPKLVTCGLWKPVYLRTWNDFKIENTHIIQHSLTDEMAQLTAVIEIVAEKEITVELEIALDKHSVISEKNIHLHSGKNSIQKKIDLKNPERWNPNGLGDQKLYNVAIAIQSKKYYAQANEKIGLRTIELIRKKNAEGISFSFQVNGKPVFMKGANYIPQDNFLNRVTPERYKILLASVKNANMNMLRVWGGGVYEDDYFYHLCDSLGILVWQDFIFACALYPSDSAFLKTVQSEAEDQIKRLRNHPSIALWCGNNEVKNGWEDWGWQKSYSENDRQKIWNGNQEIFEHILPETVKKYSSGAPYHASSPEWGWGHRECVTEGDSHYWGVWWGEEPFEVWDAKTGRFMSEYGFQAMPSPSAIASFIFPEDRSLTSATIKAHQKHARGYALIDEYMKRDYNVPKDFAHYAYVSQLLQAYGIGQALEIHRRKKPYCMGTLYWQLNDCWPVTSWSSIDSKYQWKALHYKARECFKPIMLTTTVENNDLAFYIVSDLQHAVSGTISVIWQDFFGRIINNKTINITVPENASLKFHQTPKTTFANQEKNTFVIVRFDDKNGNTAEKIHYFTSPKSLLLPSYKLETQVEQVSGNFQLKFLSNTLVKNLYLHTDTASEGFFFDNYFDLLPNDQKTITYTPARATTLEAFKKQLKTLSLKETN